MSMNRRNVILTAGAATIATGVPNVANAMDLSMYVGFRNSVNATNGTLAQSSNGRSTTALQNVCGVMCLLAVHNYFTYKATQSPDGFTKSKSSVLDALTRLYDHEDYPDTKPYFWNRNIVSVAKTRWNWPTAISRSTSASYSYNNMISWDLEKGRPVIALMKRNVKNFYNIEHFIVVTYAGNDTVRFFDPWIGKMRKISKTDFENAWVHTKIAIPLHP